MPIHHLAPLRSASPQLAVIVALFLAAGAAPGTSAQEKQKMLARSDTVTVQVLMLSDRFARNPDEYIEVAGKRYIYFDSPRLVVPARPLDELKPHYPTGKFEQRDGAVILQLLIDEHGRIERSDVMCSAPPFEKSALEAVKGLRFRPAQSGNGPIRSYLLVEFGYGRGYPCSATPD